MALTGDPTDKIHVYKFGINEALGADWEVIWSNSSLYTYIPTPIALKFSSGHAGDQVGSAGAQTVNVQGLDANFIQQRENVTLNGQTAVLTVNTYARVNRVTVNSAGGQGSNIGTIYAGDGAISSGVPNIIYARVESADNQTLMALFTIPASYSGSLKQIDFTVAGNQTVDVRLLIRPFGEVFQVKGLLRAFRNYVPFEYPDGINIPPKSDIELQARGSGAVEASGGFHLDLEYKTILEISI